MVDQTRRTRCVEVSGYTEMLLHKVLASCRLVATRNGGYGSSSSAGSATDDMVFVIVKWSNVTNDRTRNNGHGICHVYICQDRTISELS